MRARKASVALPPQKSLRMCRVRVELQQGRETLVGERGVKLLDDQRQRLDTAPKLLHLHNLFVFDDIWARSTASPTLMS
jgi:ABC-type transport system involved in Fe-S cluster assembly fused permease/ATPase subunit